MRFRRIAATLRSTLFLFATLATVAPAQGSARARPVISVYSRDGGLLSNYVTPAIEVGEDVYVFAISVDLNGEIQVLHPEFPGISVRIRAHRELQLRNFFAGFGPQGEQGLTSYGYAGYNDVTDRRDQTRGTVIALASREPFNFETLDSGGDWNIAAIRRLIDARSPSDAADALARYIGTTGEPIGRDWFRFAGGRNYDYDYAYSALTACDLYYGFSYGSPVAALHRSAILGHIFHLQRAGRQVRLVGYDGCGIPIVSYGPLSTANLPIPVGRRRIPGDTTIFPKSREPHNAVPRGAAIGAFPPSAEAGVFGGSRTTPPLTESGMILTPARNRTESTEMIEQLRTQRADHVPSSRIPVESRHPPRTESSTTGVQSPREYRPAPFVHPSATPPPSRTPAPAPPPRSAPPTQQPAAPVRREAPIPTPAPSPRTESVPVPPPMP
ncbi:MAG: hypothetical protein ABR585_03375 [Gemmatimonadaceae bacterium]